MRSRPSRLLRQEIIARSRPRRLLAYPQLALSVFCRHNRFTADCPICSKGTVLEGARRSSRRAGGGGSQSRRPRAEGSGPAAFSGPYVGAGPYEDSDGQRYEVRLERVPGGVRLAEWSGSRLRRRAPCLAAAHVAGLAAGAPGVLAERDAQALLEALRVDVSDAAAPGSSGGAGVSRGRSGDFREELRVEPLEGDRVRIARWVLRPGSGWELQDAPPMLPAARFAEALADAAAQGLLTASGSGAPARP